MQTYRSGNWSKSISKNTKKLKILKQLARSKLVTTYVKEAPTYTTRVINDIIYNEKTHIVACFKDYLIYDDLSEFLSRFYRSSESKTRMPKLFDYYDSCSRIFPNYIVLHEAKYIYKNIQRKQKMIDNQQRMEMELNKKKSKKEINCSDEIFDTEVYNSIMNVTCGKDAEVKNLFFNGNKDPDRQDDSYGSLDNLVQFIVEEEKVYKTNHPTSHREGNMLNKSEKIMSPTYKRQSSKFKSHINKNEKDSINLEKNYGSKTLEMKRIDRVNTTNTSNLTSLNTNQILNIMLKGKSDHFETRILSQKLKELKQKNRFSTDFVNIPSFREKIKTEYKNSINHNNSSGFNSKEKQPLSHEERMSDNSKPKENSNGIMHKNTMSMPKLTNNIFYIINQNPQVNTHITIYNNGDNVTKNNPITARSESKTSHVNKRSITPIVNASRSSSKKLKVGVKPNPPDYITKILTKKDNFKTINTLNNNLIIRKKSTGGVLTNMKNTIATPNKKNEFLRTSAPSFTARNFTRSSTVLKAEVGTIHLEEKQNPNGNKEQTTAREYSPSQLGLESIHNNYLRPNSKLKINGRTTSNPGIDQRLLNPNEIKEGKYSVSPINNISNTNNAGNALNKKRGEVVDMKASTSNFKKNTVKDKQFTVKNANDDLMKKSTSNKFSTVTTNMNKLGSTIKGYHIKNFSEAIKASNKHSSNAYSDRLSHKFVGMK